jgi:phospholipid/cholesterol/gamma-HCH transport system substrate-binding protein
MSERALETKVGFFLLLGLAIAATMIIIFGRFEESFKPNYTITVLFPNGQGLLKGTTVTLMGSPIGRIKNHPRPIDVDGVTMVAVDVRLSKGFPIREGAKFMIKPQGMLGDVAIDIYPRVIKDKSELEQSKVLQNGDVVRGEASGGGLGDLSDGLMDLQSTAKPAINQIRDAAAEIKNLTIRVNTEAMTPETLADMQESIKKLRSVLTRVDALLAQAQEGKGPLAKILNDPKMADDLSSFVSNLRRKGILFYSDLATQEKQDAKDNEKGKVKP